MIWIVYVAAAPVLIWLWLGVSFTMIDLTMHLVRRWVEKELGMTVEEIRERARLIRYMDLQVDTMPGLLSFFDEERNILHIDRALADQLPSFDKDRLEMTEIKFTRLAGDDWTGLRFIDYWTPRVTTEVMIAAQ